MFMSPSTERRNAVDPLAGRLRSPGHGMLCVPVLGNGGVLA